MAFEAGEALLDAIDAARKAIRRAEGMLEVTNWRMQMALKGLARSLSLLMVNVYVY